MNVLITGGYGFIGAWIIKQLLARGDAVTVYDLKHDPRRLRLIMSDAEIAQVAFAPGDVCDLSTLSYAVAAHGITHILHLAGLQVPTCRQDPILGAKVNVLGTLAVFEAARLAKLERVVYASSAAVFAGPDKYPAGSLSDDVPLMPSTHYGVFKICNEGNARIYFEDHNVSSVGLRPWTVYGPGRDLGMTSEPTKAIKAALLGRPWHIGFGGVTDFQYVADVAGTFVNCLHQPYRGAKSYNMRGEVKSLTQFRDTLLRVIPGAQVTIGTAQIAIAYDLDDAALERDLGPMPKTLLEDGIRETVAIFQRLQGAGQLDASELQIAQAGPITVEV